MGIPTICTGITQYPNGTHVMMGDTCHLDVCSSYLKQELLKSIVPALENIPDWNYFGCKRQAVLMSFAWNFGAKFYEDSEYEEITKILFEGFQYPEKYQEIPAILNLYIKDKDVILPGLVNRRKIEGIMWNQESDGQMTFISRKDTDLKKAPISSRFLSTAGKVECKQGATIKVTRVEEIPGENYAWVRFEGSGDRWAIYMPDWREKSSRNSQEEDGINWLDFACPVGKYLTAGEILQYDARRVPEVGSEIEKTLINTCREYDKIRDAWGEPLGVTSFYRPEPINRECGGSDKSHHVLGTAMDIYTIDGRTLDKFHLWLVQRWDGGYGDYRSKGFIHIDVRNGQGFKSQPGGKPKFLWGF